MTSFIERKVNEVCGRWLDGFTKDNVDVSLLQAKITLSDLHFKTVSKGWPGNAASHCVVYISEVAVARLSVKRGRVSTVCAAPSRLSSEKPWLVLNLATRFRKFNFGRTVLRVNQECCSRMGCHIPLLASSAFSTW